MEATTWFRVLLPAAVVVLAGAAAPPPSPAPGAAEPPWEPPPCATAPAGAAPGMTVPPAWFRSDPVLDATGTLAGVLVALGAGDGTVRRLDLPPESFASGPVRGRVVVGDDDGARSRLRVVDATRGCADTVADERSVIRSAVLSLDLAAVWEHRVDRATRADLGVWRRPVGGGPAIRVLPGLAADARHGPTFSTELRLAPDGRLLVASCGELACRTRVLDPADGVVTMAAGTGPVLGLAGTTVVAYAPCHGLPCPVVGTDLRTGHRTTLAEAAGPAALGGAGNGVLAYAVAGRGVALLDLASERLMPPVPTDGRWPVRGGSAATSGADTAPGALLLAPAGRINGTGSARLLDPATRSIHVLEEVTR